MFNLFRAIELLKQGKKIYCKNWVETRYIYLNKQNGKVYDNQGAEKDIITFDFLLTDEKEWEEYKENTIYIEIVNKAIEYHIKTGNKAKKVYLGQDNMKRLLDLDFFGIIDRKERVLEGMELIEVYKEDYIGFGQ